MEQFIRQVKRIIISIVLIQVVCLNVSAQIQRVFLGCSFGCTKQAAIQKLKLQGYNILYTDEGFTATHKVSHQVKFGGYKWDFVDFKFYKNALYNVVFCVSSYTEQTKTMSIINYKELKSKLSTKYSQYSKDDWGEAGISWNDHRTGVICRHLYVSTNGETSYQDLYNRHLNLYLWYYDKKINKNIVNKENDEL